METFSTSTPRQALNPIAAFGLAWAVFAVGVVAARMVPVSIAAAHPWARQAAQQGVMVLAVLGFMIAAGRPVAEFGFRRAVQTERTLALWGVLLGVAGATVTLGLGLAGQRAVVRGYGFGTTVLWVWIVSSVAEEIFCRGWFQSLITPPHDRDSRSATIWSAALFGSLHFVLLIAGIDIASFAIVLTSVTALGYVCALARARSGSLIPAIAAHVGFNVGGFIGGMVYAIAYRVATGHLPFAR